MHPLLQPNLTTPIAVVSAALWCAAALTTVLVGRGPEPAPVAAAARPFPAPDHIALADIEQITTPKADRLPFAARFAAAAPQSVPPAAATEAPPARSLKPMKQIDADDQPQGGNELGSSERLGPHDDGARSINSSSMAARAMTSERETRTNDRHHAEARDICERHGMHKHYIHRHHYLSWRCRR